MAIVEQLAKTETARIDGGLGDGSAGHGAGGGSDSAHLAEAGERDFLDRRLGSVARREQVARDVNHVMHALGEERMVVTVGIGRDFAGAGHDAGLLELLVVLQEKVGREHAHASVDEFLEFGTDGPVRQAGGAFAGVVEPDDHFARGLGRLEPIDGDFFAVGGVEQASLGAEVGIAPLGARVGEGDGSRLGVRAADKRLDCRTQGLLATLVGLGERLQLLLGVGLQPAEQPAFELGVAGLRRRVGVIPDRQLLLG